MPKNHSYSIPLLRPGRIALILLLACCGLVQAEDMLVVDFPIRAPVGAVPERLEGPPRQVVAPDGTGYAEFSLLPIREDFDLLVTVIFREDQEKGPSLFWIGDTPSRQVNLSDDLAEGVRGYNQRSVMIPKEVSSMAGKLIVHGDQPKILRVRLDWAPARKVYATTDQRPVTFIMSDRLLQNTDLTGQRPLGLPDIWFGRILEASLQEEPESLSENLEFVVPIEQPVAQGLFSAKFLGLPLDQAVEVWINGTKIGNLQPFLPALSDPGYLSDESGNPVYAGWRTGALHMAPDLLKAGENSIVIVAPDGEVFLRDAVLQLRASGEVGSAESDKNDVTASLDIL